MPEDSQLGEKQVKNTEILSQNKKAPWGGRLKTCNRKNRTIFREWPRYCRKGSFDQNGPNDHFGHIPNPVSLQVQNIICNKFLPNGILFLLFLKGLHARRRLELSGAKRSQIETPRICQNSGIARVQLADLNGLKDLFRPKWIILVHFRLANAKIKLHYSN